MPRDGRQKQSSAYVADSADGARFASGTMLTERYRIVSLVGRGGMGEVYRAEDLKLKQIVALKFLPERIAIDGGALARFHNEVRITRQISHPNVCRVYDIGEAQGVTFFRWNLSMEKICLHRFGAWTSRVTRLLRLRDRFVRWPPLRMTMAYFTRSETRQRDDRRPQGAHH
jgi:serine/threonine-protein kinase